MSSNESKIPVGTLLVGKYRVAREIGRGGMAAVYEAEQLSLGKKVAVKILASELAASTIVIERFFREARAAASVKSPYIVDVYDSGRLDDGRPFIAMELLEGESLYDRMARVRIIDVDTTIKVIVHTARGLVKAHGAGIVHRDLKPENIFLTKGEDGDDVIKILDFGLAKFYAPVNPEEKAAKRLTREGAVFGTPAYMSPEQVKGQGNVDHRADLWALGCMAYECLIGRPVWNMDQGVAMTFASIATGPIPVPSAARADLPPALDAWFKKCLERDPANRYQSARELADAFVESWGQRPASSASFPNVNMGSGSSKHPPQVAPELADTSEMSSDVLRSVRPPVPGPDGQLRRSPASDPALTNGRAGGIGSDPALLLVQRTSQEVPPATDRETPAPRPLAMTLRLVASAVFLGGSIFMAIFVWLRFLNPQVFTPVVQSTATAPPSAVPSGTNNLSAPPVDEPKWAPLIAEAQRRFTGADTPGALAKLQEATGMGPQAAAIAKVYGEQFRFIANPREATGPCKAVAFSRPRVATDKRAERPAIRATPKGMLVTWTDDHEQKDHDHVYGVVLNDSGKAIGPIRDLTPEASDAQRPQLTAQSPDSDRTVLLYWDKSGHEQGVRARFLDADGRIDPTSGQSRFIGAARPGDYWPSIDKGPKGFFVVWQDDRDKDKEYDLFVRALSNDLDTIGPETRLTDYHASPKSKFGPPRVRFPSVAVAANTLLVAYRLEKDSAREHERLIMRMRVPLADLEKNGLEESKDPNRESREFGDAKPVNEDKAPADAPSIGCGTEGCFVVWHGEGGGAYAAAIDPNVGRVQWRKKFSDKGGRPSIAVKEGQVAISFYEGGKLKMAFLSRDGVIAPSTLLHTNDSTNSTLPRPYLAAGANKNEWTVAWQDSDIPKGSPEIYAARILCR